MLSRTYSALYTAARRSLRRANDGAQKLEFIYATDQLEQVVLDDSWRGHRFINDQRLPKQQAVVPRDALYLGDNAAPKGLCHARQLAASRPQNDRYFDNAHEAWAHLLNDAIVPEGWRNSGFCRTAFIRERGQWCLASWIWTSAATVRALLGQGRLERAQEIADAFLREQRPEGSWLVRHDYSAGNVVPVVAPNDSAYVASNALLEVHMATSEEVYLRAAEATARWVMNTARDDGLVYLGYDANTGDWQTNCNIVDIGFTAGLFARLYQITGSEGYADFLESFVTRYVSAFYLRRMRAFATATDANGVRLGGVFGRGQAWALEGLIPAYTVLRTAELRVLIQGITENIVMHQNVDGSWPYNFTRRLLGPDCKGTPVIAKALLEWHRLFPENPQLVGAATKALKWCERQTALNGEAAGGIFAKCFEGAIVRDLNTSTAFVYSTAYALEASRMLGVLES